MVTPLAMVEGQIVDGWAVLVWGVVAGTVLVVIGGWRLLLPRREYERDRAAADAAVAALAVKVEQLERGQVTRATLEDLLGPIRNEQEHRRKSMETLGRTVARMDRNIAALLAHMRINPGDFGPPTGSAEGD